MAGYEPVTGGSRAKGQATQSAGRLAGELNRIVFNREKHDVAFQI